MKLELKKIKTYDKFSEETTCFTAELYVNGKKVATCKNDGCGGSNDVYFTDLEMHELVQDYCKNNPIISWYNDKQYMSYSIDSRITDMICEYEFKKIARRKQKDSLLLRNESSKERPYVFDATLKLQKPIKELLSTSNGMKSLKKDIVRMQINGYKVMNTNIDFIGVNI